MTTIPAQATLDILIAKPTVSPPRKPHSILVYLSYFWLGLIVLLAIFADLLPLADYSSPVGASRQSPQFGDLDLVLGTDNQGRSLFARAIYGAQVSLVIGVVACLVGLVVGATLGMLGGYFGKKVDAVITLIGDVMLAFPPIILLLAISAILTPSARTILIGLSVLAIPTFLRLARANTLAWSRREFVRAAQNMGAGHSRILLKEVLPNVLPTLAAYLPVVVAAAIVAEGSLSFLGLGIPPPRPSWGGMVNSGKDFLADNPHLVAVPSLFIFFTVFALNQAGDHLRTRFDKTMQD
ncbi:ABC transporter permease [Nocardioides sp. cx-173]|uniref:ABC transporter permease n=1 Tax=Nocardioides sp. cx-173 TaxID=2898796 RepID=UPI001E2F6C47|nr:ABC transporter permease [Nocardioides sp. cx-173]MCD4524227.1 ABC transporter permease [Nocardioides sp. cx-173]UGB41619.1 ABC transporter permease [Nocardioides sp. cx-173]